MDPLSTVDPSPIDTGNPDDAADSLSRLVAGNNALVTHPHLVTALYSANATPQQAQAINSFVAGMEANQRLQVAQQTGTQLILSADEKSALTGMGVDPGASEYTVANLRADVAKQIDPQPDDGWSLGRVFHDVTHNPVTNAIGKPLNWAQTAFSGNQGQDSPEAAEAITAAGYDPSSWFSRQAYYASGVALGDDSQLADLYKNQDHALVDQAIRYVDDPKAYVHSIIDQPNLSVEQMQAQLDALNSDQFKDLVTQVSSRRSTIGTEVTRDIIQTAGANPADHQDFMRWTGGSIDVVASFVLDPTMIALSGVKAVRATQIAVDSLANGDKVAAILSGAQKGIYASRVRQGMQSLIDNTTAIRKAVDEGDDEAAAVAYARIRTLTPGLEHLVPDFLGDTATGIAEDGSLVFGRYATTDIAKGTEMVFERGEPITDMAGAAEYLSSKIGMVRLFTGRAPAELGLMPGQLSRFGAKWLNSKLAAGLTRSGIDRTAADLRKSGFAARLLPSADDAADAATGAVTAGDDVDEAATGLASEARRNDAADRGQALFSARRGITPGAIANRTRLLAQRWGSYLPKSVTFSTSDPDAVKQVFQYANMYLRRGDANLMAAKYAAADEGTRKAILTGLQLQVLHAAGLGRTEAGRAIIDRAQQAAVSEQYSITAGKFLDPATGVERDAALFPGQTNEQITLQNFRTIQAAAAKIGLWEATVGRGFNAQITDDVMGIVKAGWLVTGSNVIRNGGEDLAGAFTRGEYADVMRAKSAAGMAYLLPERLRVTRAALAPLARLGKLYRYMSVRGGDEALGLRYIYDLDPAEMKQFSEDFVSSHLKSMVDPGGAADVDEITRAGLMPREMKMRTGYEELDTNLAVGAERLANTLAVAVNKNPALIRAILDHIRPAPAAEAVAEKAPEVGADAPLADRIRAAYAKLAGKAGDFVTVADLRDHLAGSDDEFDAAVRQLSREPGVFLQPATNMKALTARERDGAVSLAGEDNHIFMIEGKPAPAPAAPAVRPGLDSIVDVLKADRRFGQMIRASLFEDADGTVRRAATDAERELAATQLAEKQVAELRYLVSGQGGELNPALVDHLYEHGAAPSANWIVAHLANADRPATVLAPMFAPMPVKAGINAFVGGLSELSGKAYKALVERPIARMSSMPLFLSNYGKSRVFLADWEQQLIDGGLSEETAANAARQIGMKMAFTRTLRHIDDPTLRTQMDVVGRNFFAFSRATQAFIRRWGTQFVENPAQLRRLMLASEAGQSTGLTYTDENGDRQFVFPGSGAAIKAIMQVADLLPGVNLLRVPGTVPNLTGKVAFLNPGLANPLQLSLTPMANIPMRAVADLFPQNRTTFDDIDKLFNGSQGQGQPLLAELEPTAIKKFTDALNGDDRDSMTADSMRAAILNLSAAGLIPANMDAAQQQVFLSNLQAQTKSQLVVRAVFGYFAPAPPGEPTNETSGSQADWFYGAQGIHGLDSEYKALLNDTGGDVGRASQLWAGLHPDKQFYSVGTTESATKSATLVATAASNQWITQNIGFMKGYKGVAAYFVPAATQIGDFDLSAYHAELELGLRQHKTTADFFLDVATANSAATFYANLSARDAAIAANPLAATQIKAQWSDWEQSFNALNPLFAQNQTDYSQQQLVAQDQIKQLRRMVANPGSVPDDVPVDVVGHMLAAYDSYHAALSLYPGRTDAELAAKASIGGEYNLWFHSTLAEHPELGGLFAGVFRPLDNKVLDPIGSN